MALLAMGRSGTSISDGSGAVRSVEFLTRDFDIEMRLLFGPGGGRARNQLLEALLFTAIGRERNSGKKSEQNHRAAHNYFVGSIAIKRCRACHS